METGEAWSIPFLNDGGPLLVLPRELLSHWNGINGTPVSHDFPFGADYARACEAAYPAELIRVGPGVGLALGAQDIIYPAHWLRLPEEPGALLVGWAYGDDESNSSLVKYLRTESPAWSRLPLRMSLIDGGMILFHAGTAGEDVAEAAGSGEGQAVIGDGIPIRLGAGDYAIDVLEVGGVLGRDLMGCLVCRWAPLNSAPTTG